MHKGLSPSCRSVCCVHTGYPWWLGEGIDCPEPECQTIESHRVMLRIKSDPGKAAGAPVQ